MSLNVKQFLKDYGSLIFVVVVLIVLFWPTLSRYFCKNESPFESMSKNDNAAYKGKQQQQQQPRGGVVPSEPLGQNEVFAAVNGIQTTIPGMPSSCSPKQNVQNPADLLPKDGNGQWAQLNPSGKGDLANINLLKAGYHIGIDTVGQTLRNANLQIRSEPPNPQTNVSIWNQSTIEPDFLRVPLNIGAGPQ
jgi:hypothetical protein